MKKYSIIAILIVALALQGCGNTEPNLNEAPEPEGRATDIDKIKQVAAEMEGKELPPERSSEVQEVKVEDISIEGQPIRGNLKAPVTIIEFSDFQCPLCVKFHTDTGKRLKKEYLDTGKAKLVFRDLPLYNIHEYAMIAAKSGECARSQGKFWEMHDYMFENQYAWQTPDARNILKNAAREFGVDVERFDTCLDSDEALEAIGTDFYTAKSLKVGGTPTFFINGKKVVGYKTFEQLSELIDQGRATDIDKIKQVAAEMEGKELPPERSSEVQEVKVEDISIEGQPIRGNLKAPVTIIEFSDFQCPLCVKFHTDTGKRLKKEYLDTGKAKLVFRDLPLYNIHEYAMIAAKSGECARSQGKFWEMHDYMFENQYAWQTPDARNILKNAAREFGVDVERFDTCLDSDEALEAIGTDFYTAKSLKVGGTPTFFINGKKVVGYKTFEQLSELIDQAN